MAELDFTNIAAASIATPAAGVTASYIELTSPAKRLCTKDDAGLVIPYVGQATTDALSNKTLTLSAGTTAVAPVVYTAGTSLTNAIAGAEEFDGTAYYTTADTTNGRRYNECWNYFRLTASGTGITTIADFFGTNSAIPLVANGVYEIEWNCYFSQATAGTATWTVVSTQALQSITGEYLGSNLAGIAAVGAPQAAGINATASTSTAFPVSGLETTGVTHFFRIRTMLQANAVTGGNTRLRLTMSAGTATPLLNSYFRVRRLPAGNTGTFVA